MGRRGRVVDTLLAGNFIRRLLCVVIGSAHTRVLGGARQRYAAWDRHMP